MQPIPYPDPDRLVLIDETTEARDRLSVTYPSFLDWRDRNQSFQLPARRASQVDPVIALRTE